VGTSDENIYNFKFHCPIFIKEQLPHYMIRGSAPKQQDFGLSCLDETSYAGASMNTCVGRKSDTVEA
jgi:hypothetical protein